MNIIAIILGILSFIMLVLGVLALAGVILSPKSVELASTGSIDPQTQTCVSGDCTVTVRYKTGTASGVKAKSGKDYSKFTKVYYKAGDPSKGDLKAEDILLERPMNIIGLVLTILGLMGLIGSIAMILMDHPKPPAPTPINVNPILYKPEVSYPSSAYSSPSYSSPSYSEPMVYPSATTYPSATYTSTTTYPIDYASSTYPSVYP
jgi:hypothetical protein